MKKLLSVFWNSPTMTSWGNYAVQSLRLVLVTPLLVTRFDETEIAAWYLFASLNFFGTLMMQRFGLSFSRMFSFAMAGAQDLSPTRCTNSNREPEESVIEPNWKSFARAFGTLGVLMTLISVANLIVATAMGCFGIGNLVRDYDSPSLIWIAFGIFQASQFIILNFSRYSFALVGMNYVAMNARWAMLTGLCSVGLGVFVLSLGGGIVSLALAMQSMALLTPLRTRTLLSRVERGRVMKMSAWRWDVVAFQWGWSPTWRGFLSEMGGAGLSQVVAVGFTSMGSSAEVAMYLFSMRMMATLIDFCQVPYSSIQPQLSRLLAAGNKDRLALLTKRCFRTVLGLTAIGLLISSLLFPLVLHFIGSKVSFMPAPLWLLTGGLMLLVRFQMLNGSVLALGNRILFYQHRIAAFGVGIIGLYLLGDSLGLVGPILCVTLSPILVLNWQPITAGAESLNQSAYDFSLKDFVAILLMYVSLASAVYYYSI